MEKIKIVFYNGTKRCYSYTERTEDTNHIRLSCNDGSVITITKSEIISEENNPNDFIESPAANA